MMRTILSVVVVGVMLVSTTACTLNIGVPHESATPTAQPAVVTMESRAGAPPARVERHIVVEHGAPAEAAQAARTETTRCARVLWSGDDAMPDNFDQAAQEELSRFLVGQKFDECAGPSAPAYWPEGLQVEDSAVGRDSRRQCIRVSHYNNEKVCFRLIPDADVG